MDAAMDWDNIAFHGFALVSGVFLVYGADLFVDSVSNLARRLGVSEVIIALLTGEAEWEELAVMMACLLQQQTSLAVRNAIGSTVTNILGAFTLAIWDHRGRMIFGPEAKIYICVLFAVASIFTILALNGHLDLNGGIFFLQGFVVCLAAIGFGIDGGLVSLPIDENMISDPAICTY